MKKYRIIVNLPNISLNFFVESYEVVDNSFYKFFDKKTQSYRIYDSRICDVIEVKNDQ
jgi:hypothetical protein